MGEIFTTTCYDLIDCLLWGGLTFLIGLELATCNNRNQKPNTKKEREVTKNEEL